MIKETTNEYLLESGVYLHPYCTEDYWLALEGKHMLHIFMDLVGPEQVSPHYQSMKEYGKWFTYFFITVAFYVNMRNHFNHTFGYCMVN